MGVKERRDRERHELRQAILDAAREIAATDGWHAVTIRKVAEKIEYSPPTIYEYFSSKEAILEEEMREGFRLLVADLKTARDLETDPQERLWAMGRAYWHFVWGHPELYQVISGLDGCTFCDEDTRSELEHKSEGENVMVLYRDVLQEVLPLRSVEDLTSKCLILWSLFHGFITLIMSGRIPMDSRDQALNLARQTVEDLLTVWRAA